MKQQNIPADIRVFNILLKGYSRRGGVAAVAGVMQEMADAGLKPSAVTYNTLIDTYVKAGELPQARQMCNDALDAGSNPSSPLGPRFPHFPPCLPLSKLRASFLPWNIPAFDCPVILGAFLLLFRGSLLRH